jgi:uncharacterized Ntn-hydrolase superfamily protein
MARDTVPRAMSDAFTTATGPLRDRLLAALDAAEAKGQEREPQRLATEPWEDDVSSSAWRGS